MLTRAGLGAIWIYQRYVSPRKGFRCAYSVHFGGPGCSGFAKAALRDHGVWRALPLIRDRFRQCAMAAQLCRSLSYGGPLAVQDRGEQDEASPPCWREACWRTPDCLGCGGGSGGNSGSDCGCGGADCGCGSCNL